jgi:hypothetical protein
MAKAPYVLPNEYKEKAIANGINLATVYKRVQRGWDFERAVTEKPQHQHHPHMFTYPRKEGMLQPSDRPKGKKRAFTYYKDDDEQLDKAIAESGLTGSEFICNAVEEYLEKWQKQKAKKRRK